MSGIKKRKLSQEEEQINRLKEELKECSLMMKSCKTMFELADNDDLIEARIYQLMSLSKHYDYLMGRIRRMTMSKEEQPDKAAVSV